MASEMCSLWDDLWNDPADERVLSAVRARRRELLGHVARCVTCECVTVNPAHLQAVRDAMGLAELEDASDEFLRVGAILEELAEQDDWPAAIAEAPGPLGSFGNEFDPMKLFLATDAIASAIRRLIEGQEPRARSIEMKEDGSVWLDGHLAISRSAIVEEIVQSARVSPQAALVLAALAPRAARSQPGLFRGLRVQSDAGRGVRLSASSA